MKSIFNILSVLSLLLAPIAFAKDEMADVTIKVIPVTDSIKMLMGKGGNIGVSIGDDGVLLIDDQFAPLSKKITAAVKGLSEKPIQFVINTHWHGDHTGGNANMEKMDAVIVAHENVRERLSTEQFMEVFNKKVPPAPKAALPVITFPQEIDFHWNDDQIHVFHLPSAHTDGDALIHFKKANVIHMGDLLFNNMYPFIDTSSGGSLAGVIDGMDKILAMANAETKIIPGHGELSDKAGLEHNRAVLIKLRDAIQKLIDEGKSKAEVVAAKPTAEYDAVWGNGFMKPDVWVGIVYDSLTK